MSIWVKAPVLHNARVIIASACLPIVCPKLNDELKKEGIVLYSCPEREHGVYYGKIASIMRCSRPRELWVITIDGSPHCLMIHAAANEAEFILGEKIAKRHFVVVNCELIEIEPDSIRLARYLSIVNELLRRNKDFVYERLGRLSLEFRSIRGTS